MTSKANTRYILHKADESIGPKVCAFFSTAKGCKNGATCKFLHGPASGVTTAPPVAPPAPIAPPAPVAPPPKPVTPTPAPRPIKPETKLETTTPKSEKKKRKSSSSEPEGDQKKQKSNHDEEDQKKHSTMKTPKSEKRNEKGVATSTTTTPHSFVKSLPVTPFQLPNYRPADDDEDESSFLFFAVNHALGQDQVQSPDVTTTKKKLSSTSSSSSSTIVPSTNTQPSSSYSNFFLPVNEVEKIQEMNISSEKALQEKKKSKKSPGKFLIEAQSHSEAPVISFVPQSSVSQIPPAPGLPLPSSQPAIPSASPATATATHIPVDPRVSDWNDLVQQCANHSRYAKDYTFSTDSEWIQAKPYGDWCVVYLSLPSSLSPL
jgi:periplasmic protein TonB